MGQATKMDEFECTVPVRGGGAMWVLRTKRPLSSVTPEYLLSTFADRPLVLHDLIRVVASWFEPRAEHAWMVVRAVDEHGKVKTLEVMP
jgi:hypothetical protein